MDQGGILALECLEFIFGEVHVGEAHVDKFHQRGQVFRGREARHAAAVVAESRTDAGLLA